MNPNEAVRKSWEEEEALAEAGDIDGAVEVNLRVWVDGESREPEQVDTEVRERLRDMQRRAFEVQMAMPDAGPEEPFEPQASTRLGELRCPVLVVVGDLDQPAIQEVADQLAEGSPVRARRSSRRLRTHRTWRSRTSSTGWCSNS